MAQGGSGNDIRFLLLTESQFQAWQRDSQIHGIYDSGKRRSIVLNTPVSEPGKYYVVFDNRFSIISTKNVQADLRLIYEGIDEEAEGIEAQRWEKVGNILGTLVEKLQEWEQQWGTRQIKPPVKLTLVRTEQLNAYAWWRSHTVAVTKGFLDFAESLPPMSDDIIAGVLAHEVGHIYYRHGHADMGAVTTESVAAGVAGAYLVHPLVGVLASMLTYDSTLKYDRQQESESDLLGIRLACAAGYDPTGLLIFLSEMQKQSSLRVDFLQTHPAPANREEDLRKEALDCISGENETPEKPEESVTTPQLIYSPPPDYTEEATQNRIQGSVILECVVGEDGRIESARVLQGLGYGLDENALNTVQKLWRFQPATQDGAPVSTTVTVEVTFNLR
jgi:TonB family protein